MVWMMGHYPDCNSSPPCLVVDDYKKKHNFRPSSAASPPMCFLKSEGLKLYGDDLLLYNYIAVGIGLYKRPILSYVDRRTDVFCLVDK